MVNTEPAELLSIARRFLLHSTSIIKECSIEKYVGLTVFSLHSYIKFGSSLMTKEKKEFAENLNKALHVMGFNSLIKRLDFHLLEYVPGQEKELLRELHKLPKLIAAEREADDTLRQEKILIEKSSKLKRALNLVNAYKFEGAMSQFKQLSASYPEDYDLHRAMSWALFDKKHIECLTYFEKCVAINPGDDEALAAMGQVLRKTGKFDQAEECYLRALDACTDNSVYLFNLARVYIESRRWTDAKNVLSRLLELEPELKPAQQAFQFVTSSLRDAS